MTTKDPLLRAQLRDHEAERLRVYDDGTGLPIVKGATLVGNPTIGVGRNLSGKGITKAESAFLLEQDLQECITDLGTLPGWDALSPVRQRALIDMRFNLGPLKFRGFARMLAAIAVRDYAAAAAAMRASKWARQTGRRARRLATMMETDTDPGPQ